MRNYENGKIYRIVCNTTGIEYIGSTTSALRKRLGQHVSEFMRFKNNDTERVYSSFKVLESDNYDIFLIEMYPCKNQDELRARERHWIERRECVNLRIPNRKRSEWYSLNRSEQIEYYKEYWSTNRESLLEKKRSYYAENRDEILTKNKSYRDKNVVKIKEQRCNHFKENKEQILKQQKDYYTRNKEKIRKYQSEKYTCECGATLSRQNKKRHELTSAHKQSLDLCVELIP